MENFSLKTQYAILERDPLTKALHEIALANKYEIEDGIHKLTLEEDEVICFSGNDHFLSYYLERDPKLVTTGDFFLETRRLLIENATGKCLYSGKRVSSYGDFFSFPIGEYSTLCFPHHGEMVIVEKVCNYVDTDASTALIYQVKGNPYFTAYEYATQKFHHLGTGEFGKAMFHDEYGKRLQFVERKKISVIPYKTYFVRRGYIVLEIETRKYRIFHGETGEELTQEYFFFDCGKPYQIEVLQFYEGSYKTVAFEDGVWKVYNNAYYRSNDQNGELFTYKNSMPILLAKGKEKKATNSLVHLRGSHWKLNKQGNLFKDNDKKWWQFWK